MCILEFQVKHLKSNQLHTLLAGSRPPAKIPIAMPLSRSTKSDEVCAKQQFLCSFG